MGALHVTASPVVGIDLGTSRSSVAVVAGGVAVPIPDDEGRVDHPSVVHVPAGGEPLVGHDAVPFLSSDPSNTLFAAKRLMGRAWHDPEVRRAVAERPYRVVKGDGAWPVLEAGGRRFTPSEVGALVLRHLRTMAEKRLGVPVRRAVVAVPANFNDAQREATRVAAWLAGLDVVRLVNEPTAAALSIRPPLHNGAYLIYDFGGGTFDVTVLERSADVFRVLATQGDMALGGDDVDRAMADRVRAGFLASHQVDLHNNPGAWATLLQDCERNKIALSTTTEMPLRINNVANTPRGPVHLNVHMDRAWLAETAAPLLERSLVVTRAALARAGLGGQALRGLVLVGGTSQIPFVRQAAETALGLQSVPGVHPTAAVALGAAVLGALVSQGSGGVADAGLLLDVVPMTLGVGAPDGAFVPLIHRNAPLPAQARATMRTSRDGQRSLMVEVCQGDGARAVDNVQLGVLPVGDLPMAPAGGVAVDVLLDMDADGVLHVAAVEHDTGRVHTGFTRTLSGMSEQDIELLRRKARTA
jgi:molecular chaperone DnaK